MDSLFPGIEDVEFAPRVMILKFDKECLLPSLGETITSNKNYELVVISVDSKTHSANVIINSNIPLKKTILNKREEMLECIEEMAALIHKNTSQGMAKLLSWDQLEIEQQSKYIEIARKTIKILSNKDLVRYGPHDV